MIKLIKKLWERFQRNKKFNKKISELKKETHSFINKGT